MKPADRLEALEHDAHYLATFAHGAVVNGLSTVEGVTADYHAGLHSLQCFGDYTTPTAEEIAHALAVFSRGLARLLEQFPNDAVLFSTRHP